MRKFYAWTGPGKPKNFGDELSSFILNRLNVRNVWTPAEHSDLVMVGSIIEHLPHGWTGDIIGAGKLKPNRVNDLTRAEVFALRGHLTRAHVALRYGAAPVYGDPGLLVSQFVRQGPAKYDLGVVSHWSDKALREKYPYAKHIDVAQTPAKVIAEIASCKRIVTSSLHGAVVADSYGIPRQLEIFEQAAREGGDFKHRDYASVFDGNPHFGEMYSPRHEDVLRIQRDLRRAMHNALDSEPMRLATAAKPARRRLALWRPQISLLVPFRDDNEHRARTWAWLKAYYEANLPSCEVVMGTDDGYPFSKAAAVNDAASRARGRTFVILDADAFVDAGVLLDIARTVDEDRRVGRQRWFMPYRRLYRMSEHATMSLLGTEPTQAKPPTALPRAMCEPESTDSATNYGHQYGALMQVLPREAFFAAGGMDQRFRGWGSEDVSFLRAVDTIWGLHEVYNASIVHLWHSRPGKSADGSRKWVGQTDKANSRLAQRYAHANGEPAFMRGLAAERTTPRQASRWLANRKG